MTGGNRTSGSSQRHRKNKQCLLKKNNNALRYERIQLTLEMSFFSFFSIRDAETPLFLFLHVGMGSSLPGIPVPVIERMTNCFFFKETGTA